VALRDLGSVPHGAGDLTAPWLRTALANVSEGAVVAVTAEPIGNGMVADSLRLHLTWDPPAAGPGSIIAKVASSREESRQAAAMTRTYLLEAGFYNELASTVDVRCPTSYLSIYDPASGDYVVLLQDMAPAVTGDQLTGCSVDEAAAALPQLAALHAPRWSDPSLERVDWLERPSAEVGEGYSGLFASLWPGFVERFDRRVDSDVVALMDGLLRHLPRILAAPPRPWTLLHGDFRLDNLLFDDAGVVVLDWQTVRIGPAMNDIAYFLGASLLREQRIEAEHELVAEYHGLLRARGVDYDWDECWAGYRTGGLGGLLMGFAAAMLVAPTDRGDEMFLAMVNRHGAQLLDLGAEALLTER
jgi:hypothetical protein